LLLYCELPKTKKNNISTSDSLYCNWDKYYSSNIAQQMSNDPINAICYNVLPF